MFLVAWIRRHSAASSTWPTDAPTAAALRRSVSTASRLTVPGRGRRGRSPRWRSGRRTRWPRSRWREGEGDDVPGTVVAAAHVHACPVVQLPDHHQVGRSVVLRHAAHPRALDIQLGDPRVEGSGPGSRAEGCLALFHPSAITRLRVEREGTGSSAGGAHARGRTISARERRALHALQDATGLGRPSAGGGVPGDGRGVGLQGRSSRGAHRPLHQVATRRSAGRCRCHRMGVVEARSPQRGALAAIIDPVARKSFRRLEVVGVCKTCGARAPGVTVEEMLPWGPRTGPRRYHFCDECRSRRVVRTLGEVVADYADPA